MRKYKQIICVLLVLSMVLSSSLNVFAGNIDAKELQINYALQDVEYIKEEMGLGNVNFADIKISNSIHTYEYLTTGIVESDILYYPLIANDELIAWAIEYENNDKIMYQISTALVNEVNSIANSDLKFALIFDSDASYLYDGTNAFLLRCSSVTDSRRGVLPSTLENVLDSNVELYNMKDSDYLAYTSTLKPRALVIHKCDIDFVTQNPPSNMCWAASAACIINFKKNTDLTATDVAQKYYGSWNYDVGLTVGNEEDILNRSEYNLKYTYKNQVSSIKNITYNVQNSHPIYGNFKNSSGGYHAVVIYGINTSNSTIYIMDPEYGFCTASYNAGYSFVSGYDGRILTFSSATCRTWVSY